MATAGGWSPLHPVALRRPSADVTEFVYADGQGDTQKAISDIQSMVATGVDALVVLPRRR